MASKSTQRMKDDPVIQFSVFIENKVGRLADIFQLIESHNTHILGLSSIDTLDSAIIRMIVDDPDRVRLLFQEHTIPHTELDVLIIEMKAMTDVKEVLITLLRAEINIQSMYSLLARPNDKPLIAFNVDDPECAVQALVQHQYKVLHQKDLSR